jgi:trimethylamine--corrinoid protein Co-methyltransferase
VLKYPDQLATRIRMLSDKQIEQLHGATLAILERTGVEVRQQRARELLARAGARVDGDRVFLPVKLIEQAIRSAPARVSLSKRTGEPALRLEADHVHFGTGSDTPHTIDIETGTRRPTCREDVRTIARLCDALPNIDFIMSMGIAGDVPPHAPYLYEFADMLEGSSKPIVFTANGAADLAGIHRMAAAVAGSEDALRGSPFLLHYAEPITPLIHSPAGLDKLLYCAEHAIPVAYVSGMTSGGSAPVTLAGACALANAECLSGLVIHQLAATGAPFIYGANIAALDMRTTACAYGSPEYALASAVFADMARRYELPVWGTAGTSDAKTVDAQAGLEAMVSISTALLSRGNLVHDVGYLDSGLTSSMDLIVVCDEIISMLGALYRGLPMDAEHLALDVIDEVGPAGNFLDTDHTLRFFRTEHFIPRLLDRQNYTKWVETGSKDLGQRARERVHELLASHRPAPVPDQARQTIAEVLDQAKAAE